MGTKMNNCLPEKTASFTRKYFLTLKFMEVPLSRSWGFFGNGICSELAWKHSWKRDVEIETGCLWQLLSVNLL